MQVVMSWVLATLLIVPSVWKAHMPYQCYHLDVLWYENKLKNYDNDEYIFDKSVFVSNSLNPNIVYYHFAKFHEENIK